MSRYNDPHPAKDQQPAMHLWHVEFTTRAAKERVAETSTTLAPLVTVDVLALSATDAVKEARIIVGEGWELKSCTHEGRRTP